VPVLPCKESTSALDGVSVFRCEVIDLSMRLCASG